MLKERRHHEVIEDHLITGLPFVFQAEEAAYEVFRNTLGDHLRTPPEDISIIGSARLGFSLSPEKFGAAFSSSSDIDTVVVNSQMFDVAWLQLSRIGRKRLSLPEKVQTAFKAHKGNNLFFGFIEPNRLPGIVTLSNHWFRTFQGLGRVPSLSKFLIQGRLYRTWDHVKTHQLYTLECITDKFKL